jgi:hypothetical protein
MPDARIIQPLIFFRDYQQMRPATLPGSSQHAAHSLATPAPGTNSWHMHPLSTSIHTFSELMAGGYRYVDKTAGIYQLIREYKGQYFLSRPRRFGKSLLVQTGYLTIKSTEQLGGDTIYHLGYPNREIEQSFSHWLALDFSALSAEDLSPALQHLAAALQESRLADMLEILRLFFAKVPNSIGLDHENITRAFSLRSSSFWGR